ncbi:acidic phospholipase A2 EC-I-like [Watersipora subatra]|uniref:acidic phospholipase A2 EC-I-like n=1 Tax=Watersipora subatra TaxID=2589382 RepID=UPI00355B9720
MTGQLWTPLLMLSFLLLVSGDLLQFYQLIRNLGGIDPLTLTQYGCYCGLGSSANGKVIDCLDKCCFHHDNCYAALKTPCFYEYSFYSISRYTLNDTNYACVEDQDECKYKLCTCDYDFSLCVNQYKRLYKADCVGVKEEQPCRRTANYSRPACENEDIEDMIEQTKQNCFIEQEETTNSEFLNISTSFDKPAVIASLSTTTSTVSKVNLTTTKLNVTLASDASSISYNALLMSLLTILISPIMFA